MKYKISDRKLKILVDELGEEYKDLLIERALHDMHETDADLVYPSTLVQLDVTVKSNLRIDKHSQRLNRLYTTISLLGISYALLGFMIMVWTNFRDVTQYDSATIISIILSFMGLFIALYSLLATNLTKSRSQYYAKQSYTTFTYEIINKWKEIEALIHELSPENESLSLSSMITNLKDSKIISEQDIKTINQILMVRNQIVHGRRDEYHMSQEELRELLFQADKIISKMEKIV